MNLLQTIRTIEEVAKGIPNVHTVVSAFEDLNREDTVYSAVIIQQQSHTHNDDWFQYNFYIGAADRLVEDGSNELSVQSTAMNTIHSIVRALRNIFPSAEISYSNTNVFTQRFTALCAGAYETVSIILPISECDDNNEGIPGLDTLSTTITENGDYNFVPDGLGFDSVHVVVDVPPVPKPEEEFDVQPTTTDQRITPTEGHAFGGGTVRAVTSEIDNNIKPENIKEGVSILGVEGSLKEEKSEETFDVRPTTAEQVIIPTEGSVFSRGTVKAVTSEIDNNIKPENIRIGISILGVKGTVEVEPDYRYAKGTIDKEGLKAIGWTEEDILTYKQNKAPHYIWENDLYKVSEENKALYLLDDPKPDTYKDNPNITFIPKKNMESYFAQFRGFQDMKYIKGIPFYNTSNVTNVTYLFQNCSSLTTIPHLDFSRVTVATGLFYGCTTLTSIPSIDTSNVTNTSYMFYGCTGLTSIPSIDTSNVINAPYMFGSCACLTSIPSIDTSNVTNASSMFYGCTSLTSIPSIDTSNVTNASSMFYMCSNLTTIPQLNTSSVTNASSMFQNCSKITVIPPLDTSKATNVTQIFTNCSSLTTVKGIDFSGLTSSPSRLFGYSSNMSKITQFIVNGKINVSISDNNSIKALTAIDYDSVKSILAAADRTDNTNAKTLAFNRTVVDRDGELAALVASCSTKGWTITGLTLQ